MSDKARRSKTDGVWAGVHRQLADLLSRLHYKKTTKGQIILTYGGRLDTIRDQCLRIVNIIDSFNEEQKEVTDE